MRARLRERGGIVDGMHIANLWEDLRSWDDGQLKQAATTFDPGVESTFEPLGERGDHASPLTHVLTDDDGRVTQVDYFRADGTLLGSDRRDVPGDEPRAFTLCDTSGEPLGGWLSIWGLYYCWLDSLPRDPVAWMIADSKTSANHLADYRRDDVVTLHVVHGSHLEPETGRPMGTIRETRQYVMERLDQWDAVVFLTTQQLERGRRPPRHGPQPARHPARPIRAEGVAEAQALEPARRDAHQPHQAQADLARDQGHDPRRTARAPAPDARRVG